MVTSLFETNLIKIAIVLNCKIISTKKYYSYFKPHFRFASKTGPTPPSLDTLDLLFIGKTHLFQCGAGPPVSAVTQKALRRRSPASKP